jgi:sulfur relay (sulfurtransferase) DsrC/TusE family protein
MNQQKTGIKIESEHKGTLKFIKGYYKKNKRFPSDKKVYASISKDHLKENPKYYSILKKAKL